MIDGAYDEEVLIDDDVRLALNNRLLAIEGITSAPLFGGVGYLVDGQPFAVLLEGVVGMRLPECLQRRAYGLAGVSRLRPPSWNDPVPDWQQFVLLLPEDVPELEPWLFEAVENVR
jgi:hypothetical protein